MATSDDPGRKLINVPEEFRRAKRYALTWSTLAVLACLGKEYAARSPAASPGIFPLGLQFPKLLIATSLWIAAAFMYAGYFRARRLLTILNSNFIRSKSIEDVYAVSDQLFSIVSGSINSIRNSAIELEQLLSRATDSFGSMAGRMERTVDQIRDQAKTIPRQQVHPLRPQIPGHAIDAQQAYAHEERWSQAMETQTKAEVERISGIADLVESAVKSNNDVMDSTDSSIKSTIETSIGKIESEMNVLTRLSDDLRSFDESIGNHDKYWMLLYDDTPVHTMFLISSFLWINMVARAFAA